MMHKIIRLAFVLLLGAGCTQTVGDGFAGEKSSDSSDFVADSDPVLSAVGTYETGSVDGRRALRVINAREQAEVFVQLDPVVTFDEAVEACAGLDSGFALPTIAQALVLLLADQPFVRLSVNGQSLEPMWLLDRDDSTAEYSNTDHLVSFEGGEPRVDGLEQMLTRAREALAIVPEDAWSEDERAQLERFQSEMQGVLDALQDGLAPVCVQAVSEPDAAPCGGAGQACCGGQACQAGLSCEPVSDQPDSEEASYTCLLELPSCFDCEGD